MRLVQEFQESKNRNKYFDGQQRQRTISTISFVRKFSSNESDKKSVDKENINNSNDKPKNDDGEEAKEEEKEEFPPIPNFV